MAEPIAIGDRAYIMDLFDRGVPVDSLSKRYGRTRSSIYRVVSRMRAERIKALPIEYIGNPLFDHPEADTIVLEVLPKEVLARRRKRWRRASTRRRAICWWRACRGAAGGVAGDIQPAGDAAGNRNRYVPADELSEIQGA